MIYWNIATSLAVLLLTMWQIKLRNRYKSMQLDMSVLLRMICHTRRWVYKFYEQCGIGLENATNLSLEELINQDYSYLLQRGIVEDGEGRKERA